MWKQLHIQHFRGLQDCTLSDLARINLIVGGNNTGKTSVLEAAWLSGARSAPDLPLRVQGLRGHPILTQDSSETPWDTLFHGLDTTKPIRISSDHHSFEASLADSDRIDVPTGDPKAASLSSGSSTIIRQLMMTYTNGGHGRNRHRLWVRNDQGAPSIQIDRIEQQLSQPAISTFLPPTYRNPIEAANRISEMIRKREQHLLMDALRAVDPRTKDISVVSRSGVPLVHVDLDGWDQLAPATILGDGFNRTVDILASIANSQGGSVLIDEVENGIHYAAFPKVLAAIDRLSQKFDCQILMTTHGWETITAVRNHFLSGRDERGEGSSDEKAVSMYRLVRLKGVIDATRFDHEQIARMVDAGWEVR